MSGAPILSVRDLVVEFATERGAVRAVNGVSFDVFAGDTLGIVGESGCGKTVTSLALLGLVPSPPGRIVRGEIVLGGRDIVGLNDRAMRDIRGRDIAMIFQEPMTALNPVFTVGSQMIEVLRRHDQQTRKQARASAIELLATVGIAAPEQRIDEYPHQLSGGMRQRVMIAMALSCRPKILIADEPTTALDVTTQAQVMEQIVKLQAQFDMAVVLITHDLGVVAQSCERVLIMYCGEVIEQARSSDLFARPAHPYTQGLLASIPRVREQALKRLPTIEGRVPDLMDLPPGCLFASRCPRVADACLAARPTLALQPDAARGVACFDPVIS
ncbi:MAG: ABC transporter ATP-binding protein [Gammaproteobacteria bacterium]